MNRRQVLATTVGTATAGLAGCLLRDDSAVQLGGLAAANYHDEPLDVTVGVLEAGEAVQSATVELPAAESDDESTLPGRVPVECTWSAEGTEFVVEAEYRREEETDDVAGDAGEDCVAVEVEFYVSPDDISLTTRDCQELAPGRREPPWGCAFLDS